MIYTGDSKVYEIWKQAVLAGLTGAQENFGRLSCYTGPDSVLREETVYIEKMLTNVTNSVKYLCRKIEEEEDSE